MQTWFVQSIVRKGDEVESLLCGGRLRLIARPPRMWKLFYWGRWGPNEQRLWAVQSPWLTVVVLKPQPASPSCDSSISANS